MTTSFNHMLSNPPSTERSTQVSTEPRLLEIAYVAILRGLFDRKIPAGAFLSQAELVKLLGVPIQPVRDALRILETEGVLRIHPRSGVEFFKADFELARSTYQFRGIIERTAVRAFAELGNLELMKQLRADHLELIAHLERDGLFDGSMQRLDQLEDRLHGSFTGILQNPLVDTTIRRLHNYTRLILLERPETPSLVRGTLKEHVKILDACLVRNPDLAEAELSDHLKAALCRILRL